MTEPAPQSPAPAEIHLERGHVDLFIRTIIVGEPSLTEREKTLVEAAVRGFAAALREAKGLPALEEVGPPVRFSWPSIEWIELYGSAVKLRHYQRTWLEAPPERKDAWAKQVAVATHQLDMAIGAIVGAFNGDPETKA